MAALPSIAMKATKQPSKWSVCHTSSIRTQMLRRALDWRKVRNHLWPDLKKQVAEGGNPLLAFPGNPFENVDRLLVPQPRRARRQGDRLCCSRLRGALSNIQGYGPWPPMQRRGAVSRRYQDVRNPGSRSAKGQRRYSFRVNRMQTTILFGAGVSSRRN